MSDPWLIKWFDSSIWLFQYILMLSLWTTIFPDDSIGSYFPFVFNDKVSISVFSVNEKDFTFFETWLFHSLYSLGKLQSFSLQRSFFIKFQFINVLIVKKKSSTELMLVICYYLSKNNRKFCYQGIYKWIT